MRTTLPLAVILSLSGACARPAPVAAPPPPPPIECATGRTPQGDHCVPIDQDCRPGEKLELGVGCVADAPSSTPEHEASPQPPPPAGVGIDELKVGTGATARAGMTVDVHYVGTLQDGTPFDSSRGRRAPFRFKLGSGMVIQGWEQGIPGMRVGGIRKLTLSPEMAYGERGHPPTIPARATLIFEVELLAVQ